MKKQGIKAVNEAKPLEVNARKKYYRAFTDTPILFYILKWFIIEDVEVMVLNGDIVEYENVGPMEDGGAIHGGIDHAAIELLINFMDFAWAQWSYTSVMRLSGGYSGFSPAYIQLMRETHQEDLDYYEQKRRERERRRERKLIGQGAVATVAGVSGWKSVGYAKRAARRMRKLFPKNDDIPEQMFQEEDDPLPKEYPKSVRDLPRANLNAQTNIHIQPKMVTGYEMLSFKNQLTRMYKTHMKYEMSPVKITQKNLIYSSTTPWYKDGDPVTCNHSTFEGSGPALYTIYDDAIWFTGSVANSNLARSVDFMETLTGDNGGYLSYDAWKAATDNHSLHRGVGANSIIYVFAVDWVGTYMNPCTECQASKFKNDTDPNATAENQISGYPSWVANQMAGNFLAWKYELYDSTTDANTPVNMASIWANKDWSYLTHYYTKYNFKFRNLSARKYTVEILIFSFKAEQMTFNYDRMCKAVVNKQSDKYQDYFDNISARPQDINIIYRKRISLKGMNESWNATSALQTARDGRNVKNWQYIHKRKYVIKRPVLNTYNAFITEKDSFNTYYDMQKGHWMRIQAWPSAPQITTNQDDAGPTIQQYEDTNCAPGVTAETATKLMSAVAVTIDKKSYFKLDEPIYKSYATS